MLLVNPPTYLSLSAFKAQANDYDISGYSDPQLTDMLVRASGKADAFMRRTYLPTEVTEQLDGTGKNLLLLCQYPLIYVKSVQLVMPNRAPFALPLVSLSIDYARGTIRSFAPMVFQGLGISTAFPGNGLPIIVTYAYGYGYPIPPPAFTVATTQPGTLAPGTPINLAVSTRTFSGESLVTPAQISTPGASGGLLVQISPTYGAYVYRVYASIGANTTIAAAAASTSTITPASMTGITAGKTYTLGLGTAAQEDVKAAAVGGSTFTTVAPLTKDHANGETLVAAMTLVAESPATNFDQPTMNVPIVNLNPPPVGAFSPSATDTSAWPVPSSFQEAIRLIMLSMIYEQNNLANRGVNLQVEGDVRTGWRSTEGSSGKGTPLMVDEAKDILEGYAFSMVM